MLFLLIFYNWGESMSDVKVAILGSGNIGTDLMYKILKNKGPMTLEMVAGIDIHSTGLARAREERINTSADGIQAILEDPSIKIVFDATSASAHLSIAEKLKEAGKMAIDLTPAAVGPFIIPTVNLKQHKDALNVNMVSCAGQATTPLVYAISRVVPVHYAEIIATSASAAIGPGTRQNLDEFTRTTAKAIKIIGGAENARAVPIISSSEPPIKMTNTVYAVINQKEFDETAIKNSLYSITNEIAEYIPGYRLKFDPIIDYRETPWGKLPTIVVMNEVEGAGDFFPTYAGNLDIMTASACQVGEFYAQKYITNKEIKL